jgi:acetoin utilization deacetylase AcuC-like enzyme
MKVFVTDQFELPLPDGHRFPVAKYHLLRRRVEASGLFAAEDLIVPHAATDEELLRVHTPDYLGKLREGTLSEKEQRRIGLPWSRQMVERARRSAGATIEACRAALADGVAVHLGGGTHHAFPHTGEGFCIFNDAAVAVRALQAGGRVGRVVILDTDVHQGNGTAAIFRGDDSVFTFSIHGEKNFPLRKEPSDLDVEVPDGTGDDEYLEMVEQGVWEALHRAQADLAIWLSGADPFAGDRLGRLKVTKEGLARRDEVVLSACAGRRLPVVVTMAGGYGHDVNDTVEVHFQTVERAAAWSRRWLR